MVFEDNQKRQDRSFDYGLTYQKPIPSGFSSQNIGTRSTKALVYSKKGIRANSNDNNSIINYTNHSNSNTTSSINSITSNNKKLNEYNNKNNINQISKNNNDNTSVNYNKINYSNSPNLNNSFQEIQYKKQPNIYCRSPGKYTKPKTNNIQTYKNNKFSNNEIEKLNNTMLNSNIINNSFLNNKIQSPINSNTQSSLSINLEDLMILEEKLTEIINALNTNKYMSNECFEWWNYYFNCSLFRKLEKAFKGNDSNIIQSSINFELLSIMLCYDISYDRSLLTKVFIMVKAILNLNHKN